MAMTVRYSVANGEVFAEKRSGSTRFYRSDALGSVAALYDNSQTKTDSKTYWPYGETRTSSGSFGSKNGFVGALGCRTQVDGEVYMRARIEEPKDGRWMTVDPLWPAIKPYVYVSNSPATAVDKLGLFPWGNYGGDFTNYLKPGDPCLVFSIGDQWRGWTKFFSRNPWGTHLIGPGLSDPPGFDTDYIIAIDPITCNIGVWKIPNLGDAAFFDCVSGAVSLRGSIWEIEPGDTSPPGGITFDHALDLMGRQNIPCHCLGLSPFASDTGLPPDQSCWAKVFFNCVADRGIPRDCATLATSFCMGTLPNTFLFPL